MSPHDLRPDNSNTIAPSFVLRVYTAPLASSLNMAGVATPSPTDLGVNVKPFRRIPHHRRYDHLSSLPPNPPELRLSFNTSSSQISTSSAVCFLSLWPLGIRPDGAPSSLVQPTTQHQVAPHSRRSGEACGDEMGTPRSAAEPTPPLRDRVFIYVHHSREPFIEARAGSSSTPPRGRRATFDMPR